MRLLGNETIASVNDNFFLSLAFVLDCDIGLGNNFCPATTGEQPDGYSLYPRKSPPAGVHFLPDVRNFFFPVLFRYGTSIDILVLISQLCRLARLVWRSVLVPAGGPARAVLREAEHPRIHAAQHLYDEACLQERIVGYAVPSDDTYSGH